MESMKKVLVVIDMQYDFVEGALGSEAAQAVVPRIVDKIKAYQDAGYEVICTQDTHGENYLNTQEGILLPVVHCVADTSGWEIVLPIQEVLKAGTHYISKNTFGSFEIAPLIYGLGDVESVELVGVCTDICVVSNALVLKAALPEVAVYVDANCCAGTTPERHKDALRVMQSCHVKLIHESEV